MTEHKDLSVHETFKELTALANTGTLAHSEWSALESHWQVCEECREAYHRYLSLVTEGMPLLAARYDLQEERGNWDDAPTRRKLFDRIGAQEQKIEADWQPRIGRWPNLLRAIPLVWGRVLLAACLVAAVGTVAYRLGNRKRADVQESRTSIVDRLGNGLAERQKTVEKLEALLNAQTKGVSRWRDEVSSREQELNNLRAESRNLEHRVRELEGVNSATSAQLQSVSQQRDTLNSQVRDAEKNYLNIESEVATLRSERDEALRRGASLESKIKDLSAQAAIQDRRIADDEQYLASDRDIRELMGARKLYIADVFDVDGHSHTRKPFGRVFYTQGKSLVFYAFDLDGGPGFQNASAFQAWGRMESNQGKPLNLGILYQDSETNRRWALRFDDPQKLAEIDAVFVTVEPHGGSQKPTGKPFLYALLRKEANHP